MKAASSIGARAWSEYPGMAGSGKQLPKQAYTESDSKIVKFGGAGATQHSQINRSELVDWPVLQLQHRPVWVDSLDATLDIVQVKSISIHLRLAPVHSCDC